ncbi:MAG: 5'-methylthioadenosine/S-adenosylhomocysteine nucleosidase [Methylococcales symbiont of Hymedesmia sp. n. MRB-2018]|nr:MAG: 5'-methylthioadenosine/S-adenosylhomocysteine nucleosidase [Methylococcales symbiont of Hymedesmia sp. n. MRB-2018]KAF3984538.1 MAG: 5'-methylthioadenosine/S-adenosylhomocysteine nucleosidase [Methylococcales symbiont of Hymedesmia sp. n. MRB-2018]
MKTPELLNKSNSQIFIFVALTCEAKPLIQFFDLKKDSSVHLFSIYKNQNMVLTVTGVGKVAMASAMAYSLALFNLCLKPVVLNIGIAGHKTEETGGLYRAMKIIDGDTNNVHYPPIVSKNTTETSVLITVSKPAKQYKADLLYDMEGSAFYQTAIRFSSSELVQCIKIVSDNERSPIECINAKRVFQWVNDQMQAIDKEINALITLSETFKSIEPDSYLQIIDHWHFTVSSQIKLKALLLRWQVLSPNTQFVFHKEDIKNSKELIKKLETDLNRLSFFL